MTASEKLAELEDAVRELLAALGPCGDIDKKGNCRNHFATCPCEVEEVKRVMDKRWASHVCNDNPAVRGRESASVPCTGVVGG